MQNDFVAKFGTKQNLFMYTQCKYCDWMVVMEDYMLKRIWKKIKSLLAVYNMETAVEVLFYKRLLII